MTTGYLILSALAVAVLLTIGFFVWIAGTEEEHNADVARAKSDEKYTEEDIYKGQ